MEEITSCQRQFILQYSSSTSSTSMPMDHDLSTGRELEKRKHHAKTSKVLPVKILPARGQQTLIQGHCGLALDGRMP